MQVARNKYSHAKVHEAKHNISFFCNFCHPKIGKNVTYPLCKVDVLNCMGGFLYIAFAAVKRSSGNSLNTTVVRILLYYNSSGGVMCLFQTTLG